MNSAQRTKRVNQLVRDLQERAKELNCLYQVEEWLKRADLPWKSVLEGIVAVLPSGWQFPDICRVRIQFQEDQVATPGFKETPWSLTETIRVQDAVEGKISVVYIEQPPLIKTGWFLPEEMRLIKTIAERISHTVLYRRLKELHKEWEEAEDTLARKSMVGWRVVTALLQHTDKNLFISTAQKMLHHLCWQGVAEATRLHQRFGTGTSGEGPARVDDDNRPRQKQTLNEIMSLSEKVFDIASKHMNDEMIMANIRRWIDEDKSRFLVKVIDNPSSSIPEVIEALTRFTYLQREGFTLSPAIEKGLRVSLIRHFFSDQLEFINIAKHHIAVADYAEIIDRVIFPADSHGKLGGKSAGLFLARHIILANEELKDLSRNLKYPKTWYLTSDTLIHFVHHNNLEAIVEQKYKEMDEIHAEYQNIVQIFKNSHFPPEVVKGLESALDDLGETPIIVRSSSLLEDRLGAAFSGKYKSLFLANQGSRKERLEALTDAIAEVYASVFSPDPIEYRRERGLLDFHEEMGILIQEVVGNRVGDFYFPTFAGVAFSNNEFRWSPRIQREDGLIRLVTGLGTRAVDRMADDYPILVSPGKPNLRVNVTPDEVARYSPKWQDLINLRKNAFETVATERILRECGSEIPGIQRLVSIYEDGMIQKPSSGLELDTGHDGLLITFEGMITQTPFVRQVGALLRLLQEKMGTPVDIEFAHDGKNLYLLQCRAQSASRDIRPSPIPRNIPADRIVFTAKRFVSNGIVPPISHIVYVDPDEYTNLPDIDSLKRIGRLVGRLNTILPKRQFILIGPGRWGSRGDIQLGVSVTYADINNTAMLIEVACQKGKYTPELSFGTHFFQDLVEASIRYLPLYPDAEGVVFNRDFLKRSPNVLPELLPEFSDLVDVVSVVDVPAATEGDLLYVLLNSDLDEAVAYLGEPSQAPPEESLGEMSPVEQGQDFWRWRLYMAEKMAASLDPDRFGVRGIYVFGSTKNATAGPGSDIDILIHFAGEESQKEALDAWLEGWSLTLAELNYLRTGYKTEGLLDVHYVTDADIAAKTSFAVKIGAVTDAARPLGMKSPATSD